MRGLCDTAALEHQYNSELHSLCERHDLGNECRLRTETAAVVLWLRCDETISRIEYDSMLANLIVERQSSLFANFIPENPIIAASTTPLERRYLRHFFT